MVGMQWLGSYHQLYSNCKRGGTSSRWRKGRLWTGIWKVIVGSSFYLFIYFGYYTQTMVLKDYT